MKDLSYLLQEAKDDLASLDIKYGNVVDIKVNSRFTALWGRCSQVPHGYLIEICSQLALDTTSDQATKGTIMHELIHTCKGCMNHGTKFKEIAQKVSIYGYNIKRCTSAAEKGLASRRSNSNYYKYQMTCKNCGHIYKNARRTAAVKYLEAGKSRNLKCGYCHKCSGFDLTYL